MTLSPGCRAPGVSAACVRFWQQSSAQPVDVFPQPPFREQDAAAFGIALAGWLGRRDAIQAEVTEVPARLAPGRQHLSRFEEAEGDRPYRPLRRDTLPVRVAKPEFFL